MNNPSNHLENANNHATSRFIDELGVTLKQWIFGLSWQQEIQQTAKKQPILRKLFGDKSFIDLDLSCLLHNQQGEILERVWFKNLRDKAEAICHQGDCLQHYQKILDNNEETVTHSHEDQEYIVINLANITQEVYFITFIISSFHGQSFNQLKYANCHLSDDEGNIIVQLDLKKLQNNCSSIWLATLSRENLTNSDSCWRLTVNQQVLKHHLLPNFEQEIQQQLSSFNSKS